MSYGLGITVNRMVDSYIKWLYMGRLMTRTTSCNYQESSFLFCKLMKPGSFYLFQNSYAMLQSQNNYSSNKSHVSNSGTDGLNIYTLQSKLCHYDCQCHYSFQIQ